MLTTQELRMRDPNVFQKIFTSTLILVEMIKFKSKFS